eukprot:superscaffoldBa00002724_g15108
MLLPQLPEDVLYHILSYLDYKSLSRLSQVCKSIYHFVSRDAVWRRIAKEFLNTGITRNGTDILLPWLQLDGDVLFLSQAADIGVYHLRQDYGRLQRNPLKIYSGHNGDVCRFVLTDSHLISGGRLLRSCLGDDEPPWHLILKIHHGHVFDDIFCKITSKSDLSFQGQWVQIFRDLPHEVAKVQAAFTQARRLLQDKPRVSDGKILVHSRRSDMSVELSGHNQEVNCLDSKDGLIISGSRDQTARIWTFASSCRRDTIPMYDRVWSVGISPALSSEDRGSYCSIAPLLWVRRGTRGSYCCIALLLWVGGDQGQLPQHGSTAVGAEEGEGSLLWLCFTVVRWWTRGEWEVKTHSKWDDPGVVIGRRKSGMAS